MRMPWKWAAWRKALEGGGDSTWLWIIWALAAFSHSFRSSPAQIPSAGGCGRPFTLPRFFCVRALLAGPHASCATLTPRLQHYRHRRHRHQAFSATLTYTMLKFKLSLLHARLSSVVPSRRSFPCCLAVIHPSSFFPLSNLSLIHQAESRWYCCLVLFIHHVSICCCSRISIQTPLLYHAAFIHHLSHPAGAGGLSVCAL
jgi:hypothetical protein